MTINELIKKLDQEKRFESEVLKMWLDDYHKNHDFNHYQKIYGFLFGLSAARYITNEQRDEILDDIDKQEGGSL